MALPTTGLTLHLDATVTADLWKTYVSGGPNTGVPVDGDAVAVWEDATGASRIAKESGGVNNPTAKITTPLMAHQCLDFAGSGSGTPQNLTLTNTTGTAQALSTIITTSAFTVFAAIYPESAGGISYTGTCVIGDSGGYWGVYVGNESGTDKAFLYNYDGTQDYVAAAAPLHTSHVVMARHQSGTLYVSVDNGAEVSTASGNTASVTGDVRIGQGQSGYYDGRIGEIAVYNVALTGTDLTDAMAYFVAKWLTAPAVGRISVVWFG